MILEAMPEKTSIADLGNIHNMFIQEGEHFLKNRGETDIFQAGSIETVTALRNRYELVFYTNPFKLSRHYLRLSIRYIGIISAVEKHGRGILFMYISYRT